MPGALVLEAKASGLAKPNEPPTQRAQQQHEYQRPGAYDHVVACVGRLFGKLLGRFVARDHGKHQVLAPEGIDENGQ